MHQCAGASSPFPHPQRVSRLTEAGAGSILDHVIVEAFMQCLRVVFAAALSFSLATGPLWAAPATTSLGTVVSAEHAHVGAASAAIGTTVFGGDRLSTEMAGNIQLRAGAARLLLLENSSAMVDDNQGAPSARLLHGTATFSTANAHAFTLFAAAAAIRPQSNVPTIGQVAYLNDKELIVSSKRGPLAVTVDDETQLIPEGTAYHVYLDPDAAPAQGPEGAGAEKKGNGKWGSPLKAGRSRFLIVAISLTAIATYFAISEALESAPRP
jgi:hypothetical protein